MTTPPPIARSALSAYDTVVLMDAPAVYLPLGGTGTETALAGPVAVTYHNTPGPSTLPNGDTASLFDGSTHYAEVPDAAALSAATTGQFTIEAWLRADSTIFPKSEGTGYVHWLGKLTDGPIGGCEWVARMYSQGNSEGRSNRISGYAFNPAGGLGAGSYFQDPVTPGQWIHYAFVINSTSPSATYPTGYVKIYKNGVLRDQDSLSDYAITPVRTASPLRIGSASLRSYFLGAIGKVAIYQRELSAARIAAHHRAMVVRREMPGTSDVP